MIRCPRGIWFAFTILGFASVSPPAARAQPIVYLTQWGSYGSGDGQFSDTVGVATSAAGIVYVADTFNHRIQKFGDPSTPTRATTWGRLKRLYR